MIQFMRWFLSGEKLIRKYKRIEKQGKHMRIVFGIIFFTIVVLFCACIHFTKKAEGKVARRIEAILKVALATVVANAVSVLSPNRFLSDVGMNLYYVGIDWTLICMMYYAEAYTQVFEEKRIAKNMAYVCVVIDTLLHIVNIFSGCLFRMETVLMRGERFFAPCAFKPLSYFHSVISYLMIASCIAALTVKSVKTTRFYRKQYVIILVVLSITALAGLYSRMWNTALDISVFFYCMLAIAISYFSISFNPKGLVERTVGLAMDDMNEMVFCFDLWGKCVYRNRKVETECGGKEILEEIERVFSAWFQREQAEKKEKMQWLERMKTRTGEKYFDMVYHKLNTARGECIGYFFVVTDRTEEVENYQREYYQMTHDELTGLYNREYFLQQAAHILKRNLHKSYVLISTNIHEFKIFNELFGEARGDEVLKEQANLLRKIGDKLTLYGKYAGDEFVVLMERDNFSEKMLEENAVKMRNQFSSAYYRMHIYGGVYEITDNAEAVTMMCNKAKLAIETIRGEYDCYCAYYNDKMLEKSLYERRLIGELDKALEERQFCIFLQPQVLPDGTVEGAEALVRWLHPQKGIIPPGDFVPVFENTGLIWKVDRYVWEEAARQLRKWQDGNKTDWHISVNISLGDFAHLDIYKTFVELVEKYEIPPKNLKLEITETTLMKEVASQIRILQKLRNYGFDVEIDDFGSGYSSLNMLKDVTVDVLKLDMGFLGNSSQNERSWTIIQTILTLAKDLKMRVITEGVETVEQVQRLTAMGCDLYQGYYFAKPMPVAEFEEKYKAQ